MIYIKYLQYLTNETPEEINPLKVVLRSDSESKYILMWTEDPISYPVCKMK